MSKALAKVGSDRLLLFLVIHLVLGHPDPIEPGPRQKLDDYTPDKRERPDSQANQVLVQVKRDSTEGPAAVLDSCNLDEPHKGVDRDEEPVVEEAFEDVEFALAQLACVYHVEQLHHDEGVEDDGVHLNLGRRQADLVCRAWVSCDPLFVRVERIVITVLDSEEVSALEEEA